MKQTSNISWETNLVLGYLGKRKIREMLDFKKSLYKKYNLYFVNYKNSMLGIGGVGTVTRALLKIIPDLNMVCYDPHYMPLEIDKGSISSKRVFLVNLDSEEAELFHGSYAKQYLWPVLHGQPSKISKSDIENLRKIVSKCSKLFAEKTVEISEKKKTPIFWINDYNLACVTGYIREKAPDSKIIFSLRTPFGVNNLPGFFDTDAKMIAESLLQADIISFHREKDVLHFLDFINKYFNNDSRVKINWENYTVEFNNHIVVPRAFAMGNDPDYRTILAKNKESTVVKNEFTAITKGKLITSVSRFDKTKGVDFELDCIESLLRYYPQLKEKFTFLRVSYLSDQKKNTLEYTDIYNSVLDRIKKINETYGTSTWQPIIGKFDNRLNDMQMTGLLRATDILLIGSLGDGFNHIAVESVMSKTRGDSPMQIVTTDVGATDYLEGYDLIDFADTTASAGVLYSTLKKNSRNAFSSYRKLRKGASQLYASNWALSIFQASVDISKVPVLSKIIK